MSPTAEEESNPAAERLFTGYSGRLALLLSAGLLSVKLGREALPPLLPAIIDGLAITPAAAGFSLTLLWALYALLQYPSGHLSDELSRTTVVAAGLVVSIAGFAILSVARSYPVYLIGVAGVGIGGGAYLVPMRAFLADLFDARRGQAFGVNLAAGNLGSAAAGGLAVAVLAIATWQRTFLPVILLQAAILGLVLRFSREPVTIRPVALDLRGTGGRLLRARTVRRLLAAFALFGIAWQGTIGFLPTYLQTVIGLDPAVAGAGYALLFLVGIPVMPVSGRLGDRRSGLAVGIGALLVSLAGLLGLLLAPTGAIALAAVAVLAAGMMAFPPVMQSFVISRLQAGSVGGDYGGFRTIHVAVSSVGPTYVGLTAGAAGYRVAYAGLAACLLASTVVAASLR